MDENREKRKRLRAVLSFVLMAVLLMVLFFAAINIGSLKVSFGELMRGLFVERIDEVATIFSAYHHFHAGRSRHCGFRCSVPGGP